MGYYLPVYCCTSCPHSSDAKEHRHCFAAPLVTGCNGGGFSTAEAVQLLLEAAGRTQDAEVLEELAREMLACLAADPAHASAAWEAAHARHLPGSCALLHSLAAGFAWPPQPPHAVGALRSTLIPLVQVTIRLIQSQPLTWIPCHLLLTRVPHTLLGVFQSTPKRQYVLIRRCSGSTARCWGPASRRPRRSGRMRPARACWRCWARLIRRALRPPAPARAARRSSSAPRLRSPGWPPCRRRPGG